MSEYQYYEFQAVDRPLTERERKELRALSTRARITATSFVNSYEWGDFKGNPDKLMERCFDLFVYVANWGSRRFTMRLPKGLVELNELKRFLVNKDVGTARQTTENVIVDLWRDELELEYWDAGDEWMGALAPLRADVLHGDLRVFYLAWLIAVEMDELPDNALEPLPGIGPLTASLEAFADFYVIDRDLLAAAASIGTGAPRSTDGSVEERIRALPEEEKVALLVRLHEGDDPHLGAKLRRRLLAPEGPAASPPRALRTVAELRVTAQRLKEEREATERKRAEAARRKREKEEAAAKVQRLKALAARGDTVWQEVEGQINLRNPAGYAQAVALLADLRDLAGEQGQPEDFARRLVEIRLRHERKGQFIERLDVALR
jgi:hypothetical protein